MDLIIDGVNVFNPLEGKMDDVIESFVEFYGEKHRKRITERIKNNHFLFVPEKIFDSLSREYEFYFSEKREKILADILSKFTDDKSKLEIFTRTTNIEDLINVQNDLYTNQNNWLTTNYLNKTLQFLGILPTRESSLKQKELNKEELIDLLKNPAIKQVVDLFINNLKKEYETKGYKEKINHINKEEKQALFQTQKYDDNIIKFRDKHKSELIAFAQKYIPNSNIINKLPQYKIDEICSSFLELASLDISKKSKLEFLSSYRKNKFVTTLKTFCLDFGDNLEDYINNPKVQEILFNPNLKQELKALKDKQTLELLNNNEIFLSALKLANKIQPTVGTFTPMEHLYNYMQYSGRISAFASCLVSQRGKLHTVTVCRSALSGQDKTLVHEIGHVIEASLPKQTDKNKTITLSGFHVSEEEKSNKKYNGKTPLGKIDFDNKTHDKYELLNEIINDYFSVEVTKILHSKGIKLNFGEQDEKSNSSYSRGFCLLEPFILNYKQELIDARLSDNPLSFKNIIGEKNFETLANTCTEFIEYATKSDNYRDFVKEVNNVQRKLNKPYKNPVYDALQYNINWSDNAQQFIKHFKTVQSIMDAINEKQK